MQHAFDFFDFFALGIGSITCWDCQKPTYFRSFQPLYRHVPPPPSSTASAALILSPSPRQRETALFFLACTAFTSPSRKWAQACRGGPLFKDRRKMFGWLETPFKLNGWHPGGGLSKMIKKGWKTGECVKCQDESTQAGPTCNPEPGSLLAFQRIATCLAPSADLNVVCPKNLAAQPPPPTPSPAASSLHNPTSLCVSLSLSPLLYRLILHAQTTKKKTKKKPMRVKSAVGSSQECLRVHVKSELQPDTVVGRGVLAGGARVRDVSGSF